MPDSIRIVLIGELIKFIEDTSICSNKVYGYPNFQYNGCYYFAPASKSFTLSIEALFIINRVAYFKYINRISCYPVLFDVIKKHEVNNDFTAISIIGKHYKEWYEQLKAQGKFPQDFQYLNSSQIRWWGF